MVCLGEDPSGEEIVIYTFIFALKGHFLYLNSNLVSFYAVFNIKSSFNMERCAAAIKTGSPCTSEISLPAPKISIQFPNKNLSTYEVNRKRK